MSEKDSKAKAKLKPKTTSVIRGNAQGSSYKTTIPGDYAERLGITEGDEVRHHEGTYNGKPADILTKAED